MAGPLRNYTSEPISAPDKVRLSYAQEIVQCTDRLAERIQKLAAYTEEKLHSVVPPSFETNNSSRTEEDTSYYPPLFSALKFSLNSIEAGLDRIEKIVSQAEL